MTLTPNQEQIQDYLLRALVDVGANPEVTDEGFVEFWSPRGLLNWEIPNGVEIRDYLGEVVFDIAYPSLFKLEDKSAIELLNGLLDCVRVFNEKCSPWSALIHDTEEGYLLVGLELQWQIFIDELEDISPLVDELLKIPSLLHEMLTLVEKLPSHENNDVLNFVRHSDFLQQSNLKNTFFVCDICEKSYSSSSSCHNCGLSTQNVQIDSQINFDRIWNAFAQDEFDDQKWTLSKMEERISSIYAKQIISAHSSAPHRLGDEPSGFNVCFQVHSKGGVQIVMTDGQYQDTIWIEVNRRRITLHFMTGFSKADRSKCTLKDVLAFYESIRTWHRSSVALSIKSSSDDALYIQGFASMRTELLDDKDLFLRKLEDIASAQESLHEIAGSLNGALIIGKKFDLE